MFAAAGPLPEPSIPWHVAHTGSNILRAWSCGFWARGRLGPDSGCAVGDPLVGGGGSLFLLQAPRRRRASTSRMAATLAQVTPADPCDATRAAPWRPSP